MNSKPVELKGAVERAKETLEAVKPQTGALAGRIYTWYSLSTKSEMPQWAREHIVATQELKNLVVLAERRGEKIPEDVVSLLKECSSEVRKLASLVNYSEYLQLIHQREPNLSLEGLLVGRKKIISYEFEWQLNMGLMMNVYNRTTDPILKKQISFLVLQYLAKAAPIERYNVGQNPFESHLGFFTDQTYHREYSIFEKYFTPTLQEAFVPNSQVGFLLLDTKECQSLLPISFSVITNSKPSESTEEAWGEKIADSMSLYLEKGDFSKPLEPPILFDFTDEIGDLILVSSEEDRETLFQEKKAELEQKIEKALDKAADEINEAYPSLALTREELKALIRANMTCISRHEAKGVPVVSILPMLNQPENFKALQGRKEIIGSMGPQEVLTGRTIILEHFLNKTGTRLGAVHARSTIFEHIDLQNLLEIERRYLGTDLEIVDYAPSGKNVLYYPNKSDLTDSRLFQEFARRLEEDEKLISAHPEVAIQGRATLNLFKGLLNEISDKKWKELQDNPDIRMLVQSTLFRFMQHLAKAQHNMNAVEASFEARVAFAKSMELAQAELSTLLSVAAPFKEEDFSEIYSRRLIHVPEELRGDLQVGVGKSAMNVFAGVNMAVMQTTGGVPERVISKGTYFEEVHVVGENRTPEEIIGNPEVKAIDLYAGEFNHNVNIDLKVTHYEPVDIIGEVEGLFQAKPDTQRLTVSVDQTIDFVRSDRATKLLEHFSEEIAEGRLNFIFFRSGQKFDMLGMDNYYGSPFYIVNNGDDYWQAFDSLTTDPLFKTDLLSMRWFCLANKYAFEEMEDYRRTIFQNTRAVLDRVPSKLLSGKNPFVSVSTASKEMDASFIDVKNQNPVKGLNAMTMSKRLIKKFHENNQTIHSRSSFGFPHTNYTVIMDPVSGQARVLRINVGLDRADVELISEFLEEIASEVKAKENE